MAPSGTTSLAAVIGHPVRHSLSPTIHNAAFAAAELDWAYLAFEVAPGDAARALAAMRTLGIRGFSVTMPHKDDVAANVDTRTEAAELLGAVNCVVNDDGHLTGHNTDGEGFVRAVAHDAGIDVAGTRCAVIGAGGAARAVIHALGAAGAAEVAVRNRTPDRAVDAAALAGACGRPLDDGEALTGFDLVINATSIGMTADQMPCDPAGLADGQVLFDLVYDPRETPWLAAARERGLRCHNGVSMLVFQAVRQFELWTGRPAPVDAMLAATERALEAE